MNITCPLCRTTNVSVSEELSYTDASPLTEYTLLRIDDHYMDEVDPNGVVEYQVSCPMSARELRKKTST